MKNNTNNNSIWLIATIAIILVAISGCFSSETRNSTETVSTQKSYNTATQQPQEETITDAFLGFKFGMSQYEVAKHLESFKIGVDGYEGECEVETFIGLRQCMKFKMNNGYAYVGKKYFCTYYEGKACAFEFYIDKNDFYSFVDVYKNSKNNYVFTISKENDEDHETYGFEKMNLYIVVGRDKRCADVIYIDRPRWEKKQSEEKKTREAEQEKYKSDF